MTRNTTTLKLTRDHFEQLRDHLIQSDGNERFAYLYCVPSGDNWIVNEHRLLTDDELAVSTGGSVRPDMDIEFDHLRECRDRGKVPVLIHSHPFTDTAWFSTRDCEMMNGYREFITDLYDDWPMGFAVIAGNEVCATQIDSDGDGFTELHPVIIGDGYPPNPVSQEDTVAVDEDRQDRAIRAHGLDTQQRVGQMHVVVAGVGGVGSAAAEQLARLGVRKLTLVDPDVVEESNLPRLIGVAPHHVGKPKVDAVKEAVYRANPDTAVETVQGCLEDYPSVVAEADVVMQCVDRDVSRSALSQLAVKHLVPVIDAGIKIVRGNGERPGTRRAAVFTTVPGETACFHCLGRGDPDRMRMESMNSEEIEMAREEGYLSDEDVAPDASLVTATSMAASLACTAFMDYVATGEMTDIFQYDLSAHESFVMNAERSGECPVCSAGLLARGDHEATGEELQCLIAESFEDVEVETKAVAE